MKAESNKDHQGSENLVKVERKDEKARSETANSSVISMDKVTLKPIIDRIVEKTFTMDLEWDWPAGVAFYGITRAYEVTGDETYLIPLKEWTNFYLDHGVPSLNVNRCAVGHAMITLYEVTKDPKYLQVIDDMIAYLSREALRFGEGVLQHTVSDKNDFPEQAWADTLFMAAYFFLRVGVMKQDQAIIEDALNQYYYHILFLQDKETSLWYHGYSHVAKTNLSGFYWGRANAWAAYTMSQVLKNLPEWYLYPKAMDVQCSLRDQLAAIKKLQTQEGLFRTILDDVTTYEEVSASCGILAAMVNQGNALHRPFIDLGFKGVLDNISKDGRVLNVSGGTAVMRNREGYQEITKDWIQGWGQGLALAFLSGIYKTL